MPERSEKLRPGDIERAQNVPGWAIRQRSLLAKVSGAALEFVDRFTRPDGTLAWRTSWAGMDGSDDPYEAFMHLPLLYALGGDDDLLPVARKMWNSITWQWTEYGQLADEFDKYYDWMHHAEANLFLYLLPLADPDSLQDHQRADRFVSMYSGKEEKYRNFDTETGLMTSPLTGSRGPRHVITDEDASMMRVLLENYVAPFEDLPQSDLRDRNARWTDDATYARILARMNERMTRGDVPINLFATTLFAHAHMLKPNPEHVAWITRYLERWIGLTSKNGGILPDNVGLDGTIGQYNDGKWWGGYYGWRWPHGLRVLLGPLDVAGSNAALVTGNRTWLDLARGQIDQAHMRSRGSGTDRLIANRYTDTGWTDYRPEDPVRALEVWATSMSADDLARVERVPRTFDWASIEIPRSGKIQHYFVNALPWFEYVQGRNPSFPERALQANDEIVDMQISRLRDPNNASNRLWNVREVSVGGIDLSIDAYAIHVWQELSPIHIESLINLTTGGKAHSSWGGLQHSALRHFDPRRMRPGLPVGLAALVSKVANTRVSVTFANTLDHPIDVISQAGMFGEHRFTGVTGGRTFPAARWIELTVPARSTATARLEMTRLCAQPSYATPWNGGNSTPTIKGRMK